MDTVAHPPREEDPDRREARRRSDLLGDDQFRSLFEHSGDAVLLATPEGEMLAANPEACRVFGRTEEEICAVGRAGLVDLTDPRLPALLEERARTGLFKGELRFRRKDGAVFPAEVSSAFYRDGAGILRATSVIRDISERHRTERRSATQHEITRALAECATLEEAAPRVLDAFCANGHWDSGTVWIVDRQARALRRIAGAPPGPDRIQASGTGSELSDRVRSTGEPAWVAERSPSGATRTAAAAPIRCVDEVQGVIECWSREPRQADAALLDLMAAAGSQIGQFIERRRADELIQTTATAVASATGAEFFPALVRHLAAVLETRYAFVSECTDRSAARVRTLAWWKDGELADNVGYDVRATPCEEVLRGEACWFPDTLQQRFPADTDLAALGAESYLGIPLRGSAGEVIGHLAAIDDKPMRKDPRGLPVLRIFAARAAAELARLATERELREANRFLEEIIDGADEGIIVYDTEMRYVVFNRFMERLHDRSAAEVLGRRATDVFPFVRESGIADMVERALRGEVVHARDLLLRRPGRGDVWEFYRVGPHRDAHGTIIGAIALVSDVTERREGEEALRRANAEIADLNRRLEAENVYLRRDLIANVSHDLRTPLAALHGYLETLLVKGDSLDPGQRRTYLETATRQSERLGTLISELFELVKLDFRGFELEPEPAQLGELARDVLQKFQLAAERREITLRAEIGAHLPLVEADISLIERVLDNLIDNALRHTPAGGRVTLSAEVIEGAVRIRVLDTGEGIAPAELARVFERFYRIDKSRASGTGGAGLGLAIVKRILDLHGARIEAASTPGAGTEFGFSLPAVQR